MKNSKMFYLAKKKLWVIGDWYTPVYQNDTHGRSTKKMVDPQIG